MNRIFRNLIFAVAAMAALASCDNAEYSAIKNGVYISEAALTDRFTQQVENQTVDGDVTKTLTIRLASPVNEDVKVTLGLDLDFLAQYNQRNGTSYEVLPEEFREFDEEVTIPAGDVSATSNLLIKQFTTPNGESYAIPVKIAAVEGPVEAVTDATHILYLLMAPHIQKVPVLNGSSAGHVKVTFPTPLSSPTWTYEFWLRMDNTYDWGSYGRKYVFSGNSAPISFGECMLRWWPNGALGIGPCYQNQMNGFYFDDNTEAWLEDVWDHVAYTYDGTTVQLYINGQKNASIQAPGGKTFTFDHVVLCQNFSSGQATSLAQVRMWNTCLSQATIQDAMNRGVPDDSEGLFAYWKCDEGEGNILYDSSPNGNHITLKSAPQWSDDINFLHPND